MYRGTYKDLCHGTDRESAENIKAKGFEIRGSKRSWCGEGVYFYDIEEKALWTAKRKCKEIKRKTGRTVKYAVIFADITEVADTDIFDLRVHKDLCAFEEQTREIFGDYQLRVNGIENEAERVIKLRSMLIAFYAKMYNKKLVIGNFRQRPRAERNHAIEFADSLNMVFGIETIYCVKDISIISNIR